MIGRPWQILACLALTLTSGLSRGDVDVSEYQTQRSVRSEAESRKLQKDFARERDLEFQREQELQERLMRKQEAERLRLANRPWPVRLTEARCTLCHPASHYTQNSHTLPGWGIVTLRMRYFNQAPMTWQEQWTIIVHLAETSPAGAEVARYEWSIVAVVGLGILGVFAWGFIRIRQKSKRKEK